MLKIRISSATFSLTLVNFPKGIEENKMGCFFRNTL